MSEPRRRPDEILDAVLDLATEDRTARLEELCAGDAGLRAEIASLVAAFEASGDFLEGKATLPVEGPTAAAPPDATGRAIGAYVLESHLGSGGSGDVYLAVRRGDGYEQRVALKLIRTPVLGADALRRFRIECRALARLDHPGIARLIEGAVTDDGTPYLVVEHVDGRPLDRFADDRQLDLRGRLALLLQLCEAVRHLHRHSVLHRDLKPGNVLVGADGRVKLIDFGIARLLDIAEDDELTVTGWERMTPAYASPEQLRGDPLSTASDVYALGVLAYQLLTGRLPYSGRRRHELEREMTTTRLRRPSEVVQASAPVRARKLRGDLDTILLTALHHDPERRYPSAEALREDLARYLADQPVLARGDSLAYRAGKLVRRHAAAVALAALAMLLLVGATITGFTLYGRAETARIEASRQRADAEETVRFLSDLLATTDPADPEARTDLTMRDALDYAAARIDEKLGDRPGVAAPLHATIGSAYANLGLYAEADSHFAAAARLFRDGAGDDLRGRVDTDLQRAALARLRGRHAWADSQLTAAMAGPLPDDRELVGALYLTLAQIREEQNRFAEADSLARLAVAAAQPLLGSPSLLPARALTQLGTVAMRRAEHDAADSLMAEAVAVARRDLGPRHTVTATCLQNHAVALAGMGRWQEAIVAHEDVLVIYADLYAPDHLEVAITRTNLGDALVNVDAYTPAGEHYAAAREIFAQRLGTDHAYWAVATMGLATSREFRNRLDEADRLYAQALAVLEAQLGPAHIWTASALGSRARLAIKRGELAAATSLATAALDVLEQQFPAGHPRQAKPLLVLARVAADGSRDGEVLTFTERIRSLDLGVTRESNEAALLRVQALARLGRRDDARRALAAWRDEVLAAPGAPPAFLARLEEIAAEESF